MTSNLEVIWPEILRPKKVADCILPTYIRKTAENILTTGIVPNLMLIGSPGLGKTTLIKAICGELELDSYLINGSMGGDESGIEAIRTNVVRFASTQSMISDKRKVIIFDECEYLSVKAQKSLLGLMDEVSSICGFAFTTNDPQKILPALLSRCTKIDFDSFIQEERTGLMKDFFLRISKFLNEKTIKYDPAVLATLIKEGFPDMRSLLLFLQGYVAANGEINVGALAVQRDSNFDDLFRSMKGKKWTEVRDWCFSQTNVRSQIYTQLFKALEPILVPHSKPSLAIIISQYEDRSLRGTDAGMTLLAALTEVIGNVEFL